jgi:uncharacterized protein YgiB involved in biofilm formation
MTQRKRSASVTLSQMRKVFSPKPLALGVAAICLTACGEEQQEANIYTSANDCISHNPDAVEQCNTAYEEAVQEAERTAPRYNSQQDCEYDFGVDRCRTHSSSGGSFFIPFMAGYMISDCCHHVATIHNPCSHLPHVTLHIAIDGWVPTATTLETIVAVVCE